MYKILDKKQITDNIIQYVFKAELAAANAKAGQFIILRVDEDGERIPLTICDYDKASGTITLLVQSVGFTTQKLAKLNVGDCVADFVGPLGNPTDLSKYNNIVLVGGGIGTAVIFPQAKVLYEQNKPADVIVGARNKQLVMFEPELKKYAKNLYITTDDGSYIQKGFVTDVLKNLLDNGKNYDCVMAVGPMPMMRAVCNLTKPYNVKTVISLNSTMVDGTGMCGGCRLTYGGKIKYACVDGPEFDGHLVDWDEAINRSKQYKQHEQECLLRK